MFRVVILSGTSKLTENEFDSLLPYVSTKKQERINNFYLKQDAYNCLLGDLLVRTEICRITGLKNKQLKFSIDAYGKPFFANNLSLHFNISHSGDYVACALSDQPVGIDIEVIKSAVDSRVAKRFFTSEETVYILSGDQIIRFFEVWTKKESRIKWEGKGLHTLLSSFDVFDNKELEQITYHRVLKNDDAIGHTCSALTELPTTTVMDTMKFISNINHLL